jgi:hypothetical protein
VQGYYAFKHADSNLCYAKVLSVWKGTCPLLDMVYMNQQACTCPLLDTVYKATGLVSAIDWVGQQLLYHN